jgi:hypothetical protein
MSRNRNLLAVAIVLIVGLIVIGFSSSIHGSEKTYEIRPRISLPAYQTDTGRAIESYERMMERFMSLTENNLTGINTDVKGIGKSLVLIDYKLTELSTRMARIEKALGIEQTKKRSGKTPKAKTPVSSNTR